MYIFFHLTRSAFFAVVLGLVACAYAPHGLKDGRIIQEKEIARPVVYQPSEADEVGFDDYKPIAERQITAQGRQTPDAKAHGEYSATNKKTEKVILHGN